MKTKTLSQRNDCQRNNPLRAVGVRCLLFGVWCLVFGVLLSGCGTTAAVNTNGHSVTGSVTNGNVGVTGTFDAATGEWSAGIVITFKTTPNEDTIRFLSEAGAVAQRDGTVFLLPKYDRLNANHAVALEAALKAGAVLTQAKN